MVHWACLQRSVLMRRVKGVMPQFFLHRCARAMSRQQQTVRRQGHHVLLHRLEMSMIELRRIGSADRAIEQRIADERHRSPWHFHSIANATGRMAGSGKTTYLQLAHANRPAVVRSRKLPFGRFPMQQREVLRPEIDRHGPSVQDLLYSFGMVRVTVSKTDAEQAQVACLENV